jgi:hypothetical protein
MIEVCIAVAGRYACTRRYVQTLHTRSGWPINLAPHLHPASTACVDLSICFFLFFSSVRTLSIYCHVNPLRLFLATTYACVILFFSLKRFVPFRQHVMVCWSTTYSEERSSVDFYSEGRSSIDNLLPYSSRTYLISFYDMIC